MCIDDVSWHFYYFALCLCGEIVDGIHPDPVFDVVSLPASTVCGVQTQKCGTTLRQPITTRLLFSHFCVCSSER